MTGHALHAGGSSQLGKDNSDSGSVLPRSQLQSTKCSPLRSPGSMFGSTFVHHVVHASAPECSADLNPIHS